MMIGIVKVRIINTTNEHVAKYINEERSCYVSNNQLHMVREDGHGIRTSQIKEFTQDGSRLTIITANSKYELEIII